VHAKGSRKNPLLSPLKYLLLRAVAQPKSSGTAFDGRLYRRILTYTTPYRKRFLLNLLITVAVGFLSPLRPYLVQLTIDKAIRVPNPALLLWLSFAMVAALMVEAALSYCASWLTTWVGQGVIRDLRTQLFDRLSQTRISFFDRQPVGNLVTRTISDIENIADVFSQGFLEIMGDLLKILVIVVWMFWLDVRLTLLAISTLPILLLATYLFKNAIRSSFTQVRNSVAALNAFVQERLSGMTIIQAFNAEEKQAQQFDELNNRHRIANIRSNWAYSIFFPVVEILSAASLGLLIWWGSMQVAEGSASPGMVVSFTLYLNLLFRPIRQLADRFNTLQMGMVCAQRVFQLLDTVEALPDNGKTSIEKFKGGVEFRHVYLSYKGQLSTDEGELQWVLRGISFQLKPGESVALVGTTGAGKTSVVQALTRMYEIQKGDILLDGIPHADFPLRDLRRRMAMVMQDVFLFSGTVFENVSMGDPSISVARAEEAAKAIGAMDFIDRLPGRWDFDVRERGGMLSAGQRQLIAFLRAAVTQPTLLILDEATAAIDPATEVLIQQATAALMHRQSSLIIAHRLSTIRHATRILVLENGEVVESGNHDELMKINGRYKRLVEIQFMATTSTMT
jgi:ATP-binding cassette subfamily B multidrug efflux pump